VVLLPKKANAERVADFRPISLIHSFAKIIFKLLANRLAPAEKKLITYNQSAFIKKCCILDNFMFVHQVIKDLYKKKIPSLFIKLDISKTFDTVNWSYMLHILSYLGFGARWRSWILMLWATSTSRFLLNGSPGRCIAHKKGVRQGDPLSSMLFLFAMEPLHLLFCCAQCSGLLSHLHDNSEKFRASLYVDAAAIFIKPTVQDIKGTKLILQIFGEASGLITNMDKAEFYPIRCQNLNIEQICGADQRLLSLPCKYLGLSLHFKKLPKSMITPMIHKIANRMPGKGIFSPTRVMSS
jgi:hypothetical protein